MKNQKVTQNIGVRAHSHGVIRLLLIYHSVKRSGQPPLPCRMTQVQRSVGYPALLDLPVGTSPPPQPARGGLPSQQTFLTTPGTPQAARHPVSSK